MPSLYDTLTALENAPPPAPEEDLRPLDDRQQRRREVLELARRAGYPRMDHFRDAWGPALWGYAVTEASAETLAAMEAALRPLVPATDPMQGAHR